jgi:hypothetical protein
VKPRLAVPGGLQGGECAPADDGAKNTGVERTTNVSCAKRDDPSGDLALRAEKSSTSVDSETPRCIEVHRIDAPNFSMSFPGGTSQNSEHQMKYHITIPLTAEFDTAEKIRAEYERQLAIIKANRLNARTKKRTLNPRRDILDLATLEFIEPQESGRGTRGLSRTRH